MRRAIVALAFGGAVAAACRPAAPAFTDADRASMRAFEDSFATRVLRSDWAGAAALYAVDARLMPPNEKAVVGRAGIQAWLAAFPPVKSLVLTPDTVDGSGDMAYVRGRYALSILPPGAAAPIADSGKFLEVHKRQADGTWLSVADIFNSDLPAAPAPRPAGSALRR